MPPIRRIWRPTSDARPGTREKGNHSHGQQEQQQQRIRVAHLVTFERFDVFDQPAAALDAGLVGAEDVHVAVDVALAVPVDVLEQVRELAHVLVQRRHRLHCKKRACQT